MTIQHDAQPFSDVPAQSPPPPSRRVLRVAGISLPVHRRSVVVVSILAVFTLVLAAVALTLGDYPISIPEIGQAFTGTASDGVARIVLEWRLPRILMAIVAGAALGLSGAVFQSITRNPLGSPDIIGFNTGAYTGALVVLLVVGGNYAATATGALVGGIATALVVYVLAFKRGVQGFRLIVIGIAISAILASVNTFLKLRADLEAAIAAASWGVGSLADLGWDEVIPVSLAIVVLVPILAVLARKLRMLELGDDAAQSLGVPVERTRLTLLVVGVALTAAVTAAAGPISFVALAAPQLAHRLTRSPGITLAASAAMGAAILLASDVLAQRILAPTQLPVGVITVVIGGAYLIGLLIAQARKQ